MSKIAEETDANSGGMQKTLVEKERRFMARLSKAFDVAFELVGDAAHITYNAVSKNISGTGVKISLEKYLTVGTQIELCINIDEKDSIKAIGEVVWSGPSSEEKDSYDAGIHFVRIESAEREKLLNYLYGEHYLV